jgi:hypothetical protein
MFNMMFPDWNMGEGVGQQDVSISSVRADSKDYTIRVI